MTYYTHVVGDHCDCTEQKRQYGCTLIRAEMYNLHHKRILQIAHFHSKLRTPVLSLLLSEVTYSHFLDKLLEAWRNLRFHTGVEFGRNDCCMIWTLLSKCTNSHFRPTCPEETTFHLLHLSLLRDYLAYEFMDLKVSHRQKNLKGWSPDMVLLKRASQLLVLDT